MGSGSNGSVTYQLGDGFVLNPQRRVLELQGEAVAVSSRAFDVLTILVQERQRPVGKDELSSRVWNGVSVTQNNLNQCISGLRKIFGDSRQSGQYIVTIPNVGYQFVAPVVEVAAMDARAPRSAVPRVAFGLSLCGLLLLGAVAWFSWRRSGGVGRTPVAIPAFVNLLEDDNADWMSAALPEVTAAALESAPGAGLDIRVPGPLVSGEPKGVDRVLRGSFAMAGPGRIRVRLQWRGGDAAEAEGPLGDYLALTAELVRRVQSSSSSTSAVVRQNELEALGFAQWREGKLTAAVQSLRRAAVASPKQALLLSSLGAVLGELGHRTESRILHERAVQLVDGGLTVEQRRLVEARLAAASGEWTKALEGLTGEWVRHPDQLAAALELAGAQLEARDGAAARATLDAVRLIERAAGDPRVLLLRARIHAHFTEMAATRKLAAEAADAARGRGVPVIHGRATLLEAGALQNLGQLAAASQLRERARVICTEVRDLVCLGTYWRVQGNAAVGRTSDKDAAASYWKTLKLARLSGNGRERLHALNGLGAVLIASGDFRQAEAVYRESLKMDLASHGLAPGGVYNGLAEALLGQKRFREAGEASSEALRLSKGARDREVAAKASLYLAQARRGQQLPVGDLYDSAIQVFEEIGNPEYLAEAQIQHAQYLMEHGELRRAELLLQKAKATQSN